MNDSRRKEVKLEHPLEVEEPKKDASLHGKRSAEPTEEVVEAKKPCLIEEAPLEDDLSEISDDADDILNREDVSTFIWYLSGRLKSYLINNYVVKRSWKKIARIKKIPCYLTQEFVSS